MYVNIRMLGAKSLGCCYHEHYPTRHYTGTADANRRNPHMMIPCVDSIARRIKTHVNDRMG